MAVEAGGEADAVATVLAVPMLKTFKIFCTTSVPWRPSRSS
jgi:hypothetical protein